MSENLSESLNDSPADFELTETTITTPQVSSISLTNRRLSIGVIAGICLLALVGVALLTFNGNKSSNKHIAVKATQTAMATLAPTSSPTIQGTSTGSQTQTGPGSPITKTPTGTQKPPTIKPTPIVYGSDNATATITFTRDSRSIQTTRNTFTVATDGSGQLLGKPVTLTQNHIAGPPITPIPTINPPLVITLTVTNITTQEKDGFAYTVHSKDGLITCDANNFPSLAAGASTQVQCNPGNRLQIPSEDWDDTTTAPGFEFVGHNDAWVYSYVTIPTPCYNLDGLHKAAMNSLATLLYNQTSVGGLMPPTYSFDDNSITCDQTSGTVIPTILGASITYNQYINGSVTALSYDGYLIGDDQSLQLQLEVPSGYLLVYSHPCDYPQYSNVTATSGTVTCEYTGVIAYNWTNAQLQALAQSVAGKDKATAQSIIAATTGVAQDSVSIDVAGDTLPQDASSIKIVVNG